MSFRDSDFPATRAPHTPGLSSADQFLLEQLKLLAHQGDETAVLASKRDMRTPEQARFNLFEYPRLKTSAASEEYRAACRAVAGRFGVDAKQDLESFIVKGDWEKAAMRLHLGEYQWTDEAAMAIIRAKPTTDLEKAWVHSLREALFIWASGATSRTPEKQEFFSRVAQWVANTMDESLIVLFSSRKGYGNLSEVSLFFVQEAMRNGKLDLAVSLLKHADQKFNPGSPPHIQVDLEVLRNALLIENSESKALFRWFFERVDLPLPFRLPFAWAKAYYPVMQVQFDPEKDRTWPTVCQARWADSPEGHLYDHPDGHQYLVHGTHEREYPWQRSIQCIDVSIKDGPKRTAPLEIRLEGSKKQPHSVMISSQFVLHGPGQLNVKRPQEFPHKTVIDLKSRPVRIVGRFVLINIMRRRAPVITVTRMADEI
jgi:hypothetical protein